MQSPALAKAAAALLAACPPSLIPQWIQDVNTLVGLIGFAITLVVWWQVRNVKLSFRARVHLPHIADKLQISLDLLDELLNEPELKWLPLRKAFSAASARIETALPYASTTSRRAATDAIQTVADMIHRIDSNPSRITLDTSDARIAIERALTHLSQASDNLFWEQ